MKRKILAAPGRRCAVGVILSFLLTIAPAALAHAQEGGTVVRLEPGQAQLGVNQSMPIQVVVENAANLAAVDILLTFDPALLEVVDADAEEAGIQVELGSFLEVSSVLTNTVDQAAGHIRFGYSETPPEANPAASGTIATVTFRGKATGTSPLIFNNVLLADAVAEVIQTTTQDGRVTVIEGETPTETPTPTEEAAPGITATPTTSTPTAGCEDVLGSHVVQPQETVYAIARAYRVRPDAIALCSMLVNPNLIHPGDQLTIPNVPWFPIPPGPTARQQFGGGASGVCSTYHTVQSGENLFRISQQYGVSMWVIAQANSIYNLHYVQAGQVLCIP